MMVSFGAFIPQNSGRYWVTAFSNDPDDPQRFNDTTEWPFTVTRTGSVDASAESGSSMMLSLHPQPAQGAGVARYHLEHSTTGTITLYDVSGRAVKKVYAGILEREGEVVTDLRGLSSGIYVLSLRTDSGREITQR